MQMQLIDGWQKLYKLASVWAIILVGITPDLYNAALSAGLLTDEEAPQALSYLIKVAAFIALAVRIIKQAKVEAEMRLVAEMKAAAKAAKAAKVVS